MVITDIFNSTELDNNSSKRSYSATVFQRVLAVLIDYFIFLPIASFILVNLFYEGLFLYKKFPQSDESFFVVTILTMCSGVIISFLQAICIYLFRGTPGQIFTKTYVEFEYVHVHIFLQAWLRQIGFVISIFSFGWPFLAVFFHPKRQTFYERMTDSTVLTAVYDSKDRSLTAAEQNYIRAGFAAFSFFGLFLVAVSFFNLYKKTLYSFASFSKQQQKEAFCKEIKNVKQENRLLVALAMNLADQLSDSCLDKEADFVLWRMDSMQGFSEVYNPSMAYFAKYMTAKDSDTEKQYLDMSCLNAQKSYGCFLSESFQNKSEKEFLAELKTSGKEDILASMIQYQLAQNMKLKEKSIFLDKMKKFDSLDIVKKFVLIEKIQNWQSQNNSKKRLPASDSGLNPDEYDEVIQGIRDL